MGAALAYDDRRELPRDEVDYRARAVGADGRPVSLQVVNLSAQGLMARTPRDHAVGERLTVTLPVVGSVTAEVRWSLGGRIGCELARAINLADYYELLAAMVKGR
jgi:hypothetical protein